jgi:hypothetical protein
MTSGNYARNGNYAFPHIEPFTCTDCASHPIVIGIDKQRSVLWGLCTNCETWRNLNTWGLKVAEERAKQSIGKVESGQRRVV